MHAGHTDCCQLHWRPLDCRLPARPAQVVGPAGLGKTQLCLQSAVLGYLERLGEGASVVYIDTEKKFSGQRCGQGCRGAGGGVESAGEAGIRGGGAQ